MIKTTQGRKAHQATTWQQRYDAAFRRFDPNVQLMKATPTVQIAASAGVTVLLLSGRLTSAALLATVWFGSRPLTRVAAAGVACAGAINDAAKDTIQRFRTPTPVAPEPSKPTKARRQRRAKTRATPAPAPVA